ncbi:MAG: 3-deoxy-8-phosphooctulonate synthase [Phycisphaeraceae bacterium]|nr:3-deoxy-8-phosphooctulonate synthase [Phycisphaeraceae bacterium]
MARLCRAGSVEIGEGRPLAIIAGPCVLESIELGLEVGRVVKAACDSAGLAYVFKASFDKANRSSINSARGPGLEQGLKWMAAIRRELGVPVTTDIHEINQAEPAAEAGVDLLQIPAFLCRQTDLLVAAGRSAAKHGRGVNIKKGQFLSPGEMVGPVEKLAEAGCTNVMLTERGTFFGYGRLVNDFIGVAELMSLGLDGGSPPVCFDCTHSTQRPGGWEGGAKVTGGAKPGMAAMLARAATAAGVHALFLECHPEPSKALSDAATMMRLADVPAVLRSVAAVRRAIGPVGAA